MSRPLLRASIVLVAVVSVLLGGLVWSLRPSLDGTWGANAVLDRPTTITVDGVGAIQGVSFRDGKVYLYGDVRDAKRRVGVIREFTAEYQPTGRVVWLRCDGQPLLRHPTGLTWHSRWGAFVGDSVDQKAVIYRLDWQRAWDDGHLDRAVLDVIEDDATMNGCRPEFVELHGQPFLATADYGAIRPEVRLYDPEKLLASKRTSAPGVVVHRFMAGPFTQNLHWDATRGELTCVQNAMVGRGWRLDTLKLATAVADGRAWGRARVRMLTFMPHDELEGFRPLQGNQGLFVTSSGRNNVVVGEVRMVHQRWLLCSILSLSVAAGLAVAGWWWFRPRDTFKGSVIRSIDGTHHERDE